MKKYKTYYLFYVNLPYIFCFFSCLIFISCSKKNFSSKEIYQFKHSDNNPDYTKLDYWASHSWKKDPADSVPEPLRSSFKGDSTVDVFFIHPTTLTDKNDLRWNADIDDPEINTKTDYSTILYQASVFNDRCRVFAPRYRQAHIKAFFFPDSITYKYFDIAYEDIKTAFISFLEKFNNGRPIIIASHSQGTKHAERLLKEFFENKPLLNRLVCAYILGFPVPDNYFVSLKPCKDSASTGCFVSWRTYKSGYEGGDYITSEKFRSIVVNPLSWTSDTSFVSSFYNKGGVLLKFNKVVKGVVSAKIHKNILWTGKPDIPGKIFITQKNFHAGDINLFYMNIRENVATRISAFFKS